MAPAVRWYLQRPGIERGAHPPERTVPRTSEPRVDTRTTPAPGGPPRRLCAAIAVFGALLAGCGERSEPTDSSPPLGPPPNVLVVLVDCLRADRVGPESGLTPHLDRLATESITFRNAFAPATWTKPSVASLFTSLYPRQHGLQRVSFRTDEGLATDVLHQDLDTLAEHFARGGYATGAIINQVHLTAESGFAQGFEHFRWQRGKNAYQLNRQLFEWLDSDRGGRPFFAYLHYLDPHWPYTSKLSPNEHFRWKFGPRPPNRGDRADDWAAALLPEERERAMGDLARLYDREVRFIDAAIGEVLEQLAARDLYEDTVILVTSDHGEGFDEHGELQHGYAPFEEVMRIPMILRVPGLARAEPPEPVSLVDVLPTLTALAGLAEPEGVAGRDLSALWEGREWQVRMVFSEGVDALGVRSERGKGDRGRRRDELLRSRSRPGRTAAGWRARLRPPLRRAQRCAARLRRPDPGRGRG